MPKKKLDELASPHVFKGRDLVVMGKAEARQLVAFCANLKPRTKAEAQRWEASGIYDLIDSISQASK